MRNRIRRIDVRRCFFNQPERERLMIRVKYETSAWLPDLNGRLLLHEIKERWASLGNRPDYARKAFKSRATVNPLIFRRSFTYRAIVVPGLVNSRINDESASQIKRSVSRSIRKEIHGIEIFRGEEISYSSVNIAA